LDERAGKKQWIPPNLLTAWHDYGEWSPLFVSKWLGLERWTSFHDHLFNGEVDDVTRRRKSFFSNTLVLPSFNALEATTINPKSLDPLKHTLVLRGRHLENAVFNGADLREADLQSA
jgi:hypothetical protein